MSYVKDFQNVIASHNYPALIRLWEEYSFCDEIDLLELAAILQAIKGSEMAEGFGTHVERILPHWKIQNHIPAAHTVLKLIFDLETTDSPALVQLASEYITEHYATNAQKQDRLRVLGLRNKTSFKGLLSQCDLLFHLDVGNFVFHTGGWGVGEILELSLVREQIVVEFEHVGGKKDLSFLMAFKSLEPIAKGHFFVARFSNPEELERLAKKNPIDIVKWILKDLGPQNAAAIKEELVDIIIPSKEWVRWWQATKIKLRKDRKVVIPEDPKDPLILQEATIDHEDRLEKILGSSLPMERFLPELYGFLKDYPEALKQESSQKLIATYLERAVIEEPLSPAQLVQAGFLLVDVRADNAQHRLTQWVHEVVDFAQVLHEIAILSFKKRFLIEVKKIRADWPVLFIEALFLISQSPLKDYILTELLQAGEQKLVFERLSGLCNSPETNPELFLWYFQKVMQKKDEGSRFSPEVLGWFEGLFLLLAAIENIPACRDTVRKIVAIITADRFSLVREIMQQASREEIQELLLIASKAHSLPRQEQTTLRSLANVVYPGFFVQQGNLEKEEEVFWATEEAFLQARKRLEKLHIAMLENAKEIAVAAEMGDLRENGDFKAAVERKRLIQEEMRSLSSQIGQARVITKDDLLPSEVGIGSVVLCQEGDGSKKKFVILGVWEVELSKEQNKQCLVLSFGSRLAKELLGRAVGDQVLLPKEQERIHATIIGLSTFVEDRSWQWS